MGHDPGGSPISDTGTKGLKGGALNLASATVIGVASTAPAYSLAATLGLVVVSAATKSPFIVLLAFVPMMCTAIAYQQLNKIDPDCGTTFTWAARAFGPRTGWMGGWGIIVADVLVMASLAQVAGQYLFLLFGANGIGQNPTSSWVLTVGVAWIVVMTWICYRGIELSARIQQFLLTIEIVMLSVFSVTALVKVYGSHPPGTSIRPSFSWLTPSGLTLSSLVSATLLMVFIYWGWDSAVACNEETADRSRIPGLAAVLSTLILLGTYLLVTVSAQAFAGVSDKGIGLSNPDNASDVINVIGKAVFGSSGFGTVLVRLLLLMVLSSAAASTQTTILPTARTTLAMGAYRALPESFARVHPKYFTPTFSTIAMGVVSVAVYVPFNYFSHGNLIPDAVTAIGLAIAFYYGMTGFVCAWTFRNEYRDGLRTLMVKIVLPLIGGIMLLGAFVKTSVDDFSYKNGNGNSFTSFHGVGGVFILGVGSLILGALILSIYQARSPRYFSGASLLETPSVVAANTE